MARSLVKMNVQENRRTWVPQELLHYKPMPGVVGPWYGMSTAVSFDPDLIFVFLVQDCKVTENRSHPESSFQWIGNRSFQTR